MARPLLNLADPRPAQLAREGVAPRGPRPHRESRRFVAVRRSLYIPLDSAESRIVSSTAYGVN